MSNDFHSIDTDHPKAPIIEASEPKPAESKGKSKSYLWLNVVWFIPVIVVMYFLFRSPFVIKGTTLVKYRGFAAEVVIPQGVTKIGKLAFSECHSLTSVVIPKGVTKIGNEAFLGCSSLTSVVIPEGVTVIGVYAFYGCRSLTSVEIPKGIKEIGRYAFNGCSSLTSVVIPEGVKEIGNRAFDDCQKLTIYAPAGSKAEEYAKEKNIPFQVK